MLSTGGFTLVPEESIEVTVVVVAKEASRLSEALSELRQQFRTIEESGVLRVFGER